MQRCGEYYAGRCLLGGHRFAAPAPPPVSVSVSVSASAHQSVDAQRAHLERVLAATTTVLFLASVSYIALSTLYGCIQAGSRRRREQGGHGDSGAPAPSAAACELTKRALEEIPVHVVVQVEVEEEEADCAVCLAEYTAGDEVRVLPACRHGFHKECVDRWLLTRAPTCPVCRAPVGLVDQPDAKEDCATGHADADRGGGIGVTGARVLPAMWP